ncbi:hypothetical protein OAJ18_01335 [Pelagibacteraceae bacterium]|nr:hypothetical protein [Pelagibacteraceae bacterium]
MEPINRIRTLSIWIFIIPVIVLNLCLFISINYHLLEGTILSVDQIGRSGFTIPYIDGGISISRSARTYPTYLLFKPGMIITAIFLVQYWLANNRLFQNVNTTSKKNYFLFFGISSAIFLILHSILLGLDFENDLYKFLRRFILLGFIIFEVIAQVLLVITIIKAKPKIEILFNNKILSLKIILVSILSLVALLAIPVLNSQEYTHFKHALEWNYFLGIVTFYLLTFLFWKKKKTSVHTP